MTDINLLVAENVKRLREAAKLSLDGLAKASGVSKSMLSQIERGDVNPTLSTVWKIAAGLKVSFTDLTVRPAEDFDVLDKSGAALLTADEGRYRNYSLFGFDTERRFEICYIEIEPGGHLSAEAHPPGTQEFVTVFSGELAVEAGGRILCGGEGSAMRFVADMPHSYYNKSSELCRLNMLLYYPRTNV